MANRKVLINRHSTKNQAPAASEMFHGEIAVSHPSEVSATTIYTRNGNEMVPFISCAQTKTMIDNAIAAADVTYEVKKAEGEAFINVGKATEGSVVTFTLSSDDIQSKDAFDAYSAETKVRIDKNASAITETLGIISALTDVVDTFSAATVSEFSSAFTAINKLSGDTEAAIDAAIKALDSEGKVSAAGKYLTGIGIADGKISGITEADIPVLSKVVSGAGNVFTDIEVNDHEIVINKGMTVASDADLQALSSATVDFSGATDAKFTELSAYTEDVDNKVKALSAGTISISGFAHGEIVELSGAVQANKSNIDNLSGATVAEFNSAFTAIQAMDKDADAVAGQVVTTVSEVDGVVSETKANVKDLQLGGYSKDTTATGDIASTDTINAALSKLENKAAAITIVNADKSINVTTGATGTDINVNIKSGEKVLAKDGDAGLYTDIDLVKITTGLPAEIKERYQLLATDNSRIGVNIDVPKDSHIVSINYITTGEHAQNLEYVYIDASGVTQTTYVDMSELVLEAEFASGVTVTDHIAHGVVDPASESFLTVGGAGFKLSGVQDAIDAKVNALDVTGDTAAAGQYVAAIEQTDGVVAVKTRANVSEAVLNNYAKGSDATAVAATDTVNQAISKLENQVDAAKAAATTKVVEGTDAGNNMTITPTTSATDGSVTYTVDLADVASKTALDAEIAARKAVDGQNGDTYAANAGTNFISDATSLNDADVKLDAAIKALSGDTDAAIKALDSVGSASTTGHYLTSVTITDGKISAVGEEKLPAAIPVTTVNGTTGDTAAAVIASVVTGGTEGHQLTLNYSNKVFSATTAESADTAASADKVANALTMTDGTATQTYDGSKAKTLTFGTTGEAGLKSMSMTSAGVVDVEVIDCGEY